MATESRKISRKTVSFSKFPTFRAEIIRRRRILVPVKSHLNMTAKAIQKIESGEDLRGPMVEKYLELIGHSATVTMGRRSRPAEGRLPIGKLSEAALLAVKSDSMANRDVARALGKGLDYFSLKDTKPSLEFAVEILQFLGYELSFFLANEGLTESMSANLELKRGKLGLLSERTGARTQRQTEAAEELKSLFI